MTDGQQPAMSTDEVVERVGALIHAGRLDPTVAHETIGAVAAWNAGYPDLAIGDVPADRRALFEQVLTAAGVPVPWPADQSLP